MRHTREHKCDSPKPPVANDNRLTRSHFQSLLSDPDWASLPAAVRNRFAPAATPKDATVYRGYVVKTQANMAGRLLAALLRIIRSPLPLETDNANRVAIVTVTENQDGSGQYWSRHYARKRGCPQIIQSHKTFTGPTGLEEHISYGLGMALNICVQDEALLFQSDHYFCRVFGMRLRLPRWMSPGALTVGHTDHGDGWFEFSLTLIHPFFGDLFEQRIMFRDETS